MNLTTSIYLACAFLFLSCRQKSPNDNRFFQPYQRPVQQAAPSIKPAQPDTLQIAQQTAGVKRTRAAVNPNDKYFIVVASFTVYDFALEKKAEMRVKGFKADLVMTNDDGWYRLAIESYNDRKEAETALEEIRKMGGQFASCRILSKSEKP